MLWRCDLFVGISYGVGSQPESAKLIEFAMIHRMAGTNEDVTVRMKKNELGWFGHVERISDERMAKNIYDGKVSGNKGRDLR